MKKTHCSTDATHLYAVIMAGGKGERFWPVGCEKRPKQLLNLMGKKSFIEETVSHLSSLIPQEHILVITNQRYVRKIRSLLQIPVKNVVGEPVGRDTAPCVALATALVRLRDPDATMILLPSDHFIRPVKAFQKTLKRAVKIAQSGSLVTVGIPISDPSTEYGYLQLSEKNESGFYRVLGFKEKPDHVTAKRYLEAGNYRWNSGMFVWRTDAISTAFHKHAPDLGERMEKWISGADFTVDFEQCRKISIDYAVMEKADNIVAVDPDFEWRDMGSWSSMRTALPIDENNNAIKGNFIAVESRDNVFFSEDETPIGVIGMNGIAVIKSDNGILVCPLAEEQKIKKVTAKLKD